MINTKTAEGGILTIAGSIAVQNGVPMLLGFAQAHALAQASTVDTFDPETNTGYQRLPMQSRVRQATAYYERGGRMPNPLLLNLRKNDVHQVEIEIDNRAGYDEAIRTGGHWIGTGRIVVDYADVKIYVYDGQHRGGAIEEAVDASPEDFAEFPVPVSLTLGLDDAEEMKEFYEVNNNAKSVKVDLAWELLRKMAAEDEDLAEFLEVSNQDWKTKGADVTDALLASGGLWHDKIQRANVKKVRADNLVLNLSQFIRSLQPVLAMPALKKADPEQIAVVIDAYWEGIRKVMPEPFDEPKSYVLQKGPGAIAFHRVLPQVIEVLRARGDRLGDADAYARVLEDLPTLSGEVVHEDGRSEMVTGAKFWLSGPEGVASQWTGDAGRKRLAVRIQTLLPRPSDDLNL